MKPNSSVKNVKFRYFLFFYPSFSQIRGHIAGSSPPLPSTVRALHFFREKILALSSLVDWRLVQ